MDVKEAVKLAKQYVLDLFAEEKINDLGLEEVEFYAGEWLITLGFSRPWDEKHNAFTALSMGPVSLHRSYKIVHIDDKAGQVKSVKHREVPS
uniref:hypothetical protein n=1 Tax=Candidatus Electronema sp. TaxID=2698783 RepID=UPI004056B7CA